MRNELIEKSIAKISEEYISKIYEDYDVITNYGEAERRVESPVEQLFLFCLIHTAKKNDIDPFVDPSDWSSIEIKPQYQIGKYFTDFGITMYNFFPEYYKSSQLIVEIDSKQFHDRNERERSYEKKRERFVVESGYRIFRFTAVDIMKNPIECCEECIEFLQIQNRTEKKYKRY